jgi:TonB-linked SusC/RagA family outer membrane protein
MLKKLLLSMTVLVGVLGSLQAQDRTVSGRVTGSDDNGGLPGANVAVRGTTRGTTTDANGTYRLSVPEGSTLVFSAVGYTRQEIAVGTRTTVDVVLQAENSQLNEVVVIGYGTATKREITGAQASVGGDEIRNVPIPSIDRLLQGRGAGVQINSNNGIPGGSTQVRIRGVGSISAGNDPLYIIDGVQIAPGDRSRRITSSNPLNAINPNDIESIEVLKDAAAASIYGAQAANGVIIITTRTGKAGKPQVNFSAYTGFTELLYKFPLLTGPEWVQLRREAAVNAGGEGAGAAVDQAFGPAASAPNFDWQDAVTRRGPIQQLDLSVSGGNERSRYFVGGSYNNTVAQFIGTDFKRGTFRVNLDSELSDKFSLETRLNLSTVSQNSSFSPAFNTNNVFVTALGRLPMDNPYNAEGTFNQTLRGTLGPNSNPLAIIAYNINAGTTIQGIGNFALNYDIVKGLRFRSAYSIDFLDVTENQFFDARTPAGAANNGIVRQSGTRVINWQTDQTLNYTRNFNDRHDVSALLGFNYRNETVTSFDGEGSNVATPDFRQSLQGLSNYTASSAYSAWKLASVFGRLSYTLDKRYVINGVLRYDGVSRFGANRRFGLFPSVGASWVISEEGFLKDQNVVNDLKLRASYGATGNSSIGNFAARSLFNSTLATAYAGRAGIGFVQLGNADLSWESNVSFNAGVDYGLLNNRVSGSVDYYIRTTKDLLLNVPLPGTSGFASIARNIGELQNRGLEIAISTKNLTGALKWTTDFNIAFNRNKVTKLLENKDLPDNGLFLGKPLGTPFVARWAGVNPADGRAMWLDTLGNITYLPQARDRVLLDRSTINPRYFGGITNTFSYRGVEVTGFFQYQVGNLGFNANRSFSAMDYRFDTNQDREVLERWQKPGDITDVPRLLPGAIEPGSSSSVLGGAISSHDRFYEDASYIRLKQLTVAYNFPTEWLSKIKMRTARVYLQGVNLWTYTRYKGFDPEYTANATDIGIFPQGKSFVGGVQIGF